jgi:hypothetical protein
MVFFDDKYANAVQVPNLLPYFHTCDAFAFRTILETRELHAMECQVFNREKLLYLFYGKPAYKTPNKSHSKLTSFLPITFILDGNFISDIKRIVPFDSGAFCSGMYKEYLHPKMTVNDFLMHPLPSSIGKTVGYFYDTNENYFSFNPKNNIEYGELDYEIESYFNLIRSANQGLVDDRRGTIEIQLGQNVPLNENSLKALILPRNLLSAPSVEKILVDECKAELIPYDCYGVGSDLYYTNTLELARNYINNKYLKC